MKKSLLFLFLSFPLAGMAQSDSLGNIRYNDEGIEGYITTGVGTRGWVRLDNYTTFFSTTPFYNRTERNTWFTLGSFNVPDTGQYLVILEASAVNSVSYDGGAPDQDLVGSFRLTRSPGDYPIISEPFNIKISDADGRGGRFYFISLPVKGFYMNMLTGGAVLKLQVQVPNSNRSKTSGPATWSTGACMVRLIRLR